MEQNHAVQLTKKLVQIESTNPGSGEMKIAMFLKDYFHALGTEEVSIETQEVFPGRENIMAVLKGKPESTELVWICHMDTVPVGEGWTKKPFEGEIVREKNSDEHLYGRGACDMKSGFACALAAFSKAAEYAKAGKIPQRTLKLIATVDEEGDMQGVEQVISSGWVRKDSLVLDMEPTNGEIQAAHKGRIWFEIDVQGITAHASTPWKGADAILAMAEVLVSLKAEIDQWKEHEHLGKTTISFGKISGGTQPYVVSDFCTVTVDVRVVPPYTVADAEKAVKEAIANAEGKITGAKGSYRITGNRPGIEQNENSPLRRSLQEAIQKVTGKSARIGIFPGYTDSAVIAGKLNNTNCMSYGPGDLELAHKPDEYVPVADMIRCENVLTELVCSMLFK